MEQVKIITDKIDNLKRIRHIDILFSKTKYITKYYYPSIFFHNDFGKSQIAKCNNLINNYITL